MSVRIGVDFRAALAQPCGIARYAVELSRGLLSLRENTELVLYAATRFGAASAQIPRAIREHPVPADDYLGAIDNGYGTDKDKLMAADAITDTGGGQSHNNMQPYGCVNFIIALVGLYPSRN